MGLGRLAPIFRKSRIDLDVVRSLNEADLRELGLELGDRKRVLAAIAKLDTASVRADSPTMAGHIAAERRQLTVLFADMVGSTALSQRLDPEDFGATLRSWQDITSGAVARFGGYVAKFMGDGALAYFGWPRSLENDAERAVHAGLAITAATAAWRVPGRQAVAARVGIAMGLVVVGEIIGEGPSQEQMVAGETPNLAARLQAEAAPGQVVVAETTRRLVSAFDMTSLGRLALRGLAEPVEAHVVRTERHAPSRFEARAGNVLSPQQGRAREFAQLVEAWRESRAGKGQAILLVGEAGIGKSRILHALLDSLKGEPHIRLQYQCSPLHADSAFWPITQQLSQAAGFEPDDTEARRLDKLEALMAQSGTAATGSISLVSTLMGLGGADRYGRLTLAPAVLRARTLDTLVDHVLGLARHNPVVLVLEDAHWIDPTTLEWVEKMIAAANDAAVLVAISSRPDNQPALTDHSHISRFALDRLDRGGVEAIVRGLGGGRISESTVSAIVARSDGVPLYAEELTKSVIESGAVDIPATLHETLMARLDRAPEAKEIAQTAACIGREFDFATLAAVAGGSEVELLDGLERLGRAELIFRQTSGGGSSYAFKHALVRDAAYESLLRRRRQTIHARLVSVLEAGKAPPEVLGRHAELAGMTDRAVQEFARGGAAAAARPAYTEAVASYDAALRLLATLTETIDHDQRALPIEIARGQVLAARFGYAADETAAAFERARALAEKVGDAKSLFEVDFAFWRLIYVRGRLPDALALGQRSLSACDPDDPADVRPVVLRMVGAPLVMMGHFTEGMTALLASVAHHDPVRHAIHAQRYGVDNRGTGLIMLAFARWSLGAVGAALDDIAASLAISRQADDALARCYGLGLAAMISTTIDPANARELIDELMEESRRNDAQYWLAWAHALRAGARSAMGDNLGALDDALLGREFLDRSHDHLNGAVRLNLTAQAQISLGRLDDAATTLQVVETLLDAGPCWTASDTRRIEGDLMLARGNAAAAEVCWWQAISIARSQGATSWELRASLRLARLAADQCRPPDETRKLLSAVLTRIEGGNATPDVAEAAALLRSLGETISPSV